MATEQGAPTLPWSRLPHIFHPLPSPTLQPHQAPPPPPPPPPPPSQVLFTPRFRAATTRPPPQPTATPPLLKGTTVVGPSSPPPAPQQLVARATAAPTSSPIVPKDTQFGAAATSPVVTRAATPTSSPLKSIKRSPKNTSSVLTCCLM
ncbi:proline-rich receptor-like protein kinase PERK2 [Cynara cardunculus var. scolymus]|uniref:proline-rich receptor-like protein kinase PERK2 n=1 Tax=Cynara cardunculus var. scolymus TaxID=59895 RepID=UPI000D62E441|nr:proline-rich receptor-like protein kinase PERK2 [Cynara cardunculus var. scolymus]